MARSSNTTRCRQGCEKINLSLTFISVVLKEKAENTKVGRLENKKKACQFYFLRLPTLALGNSTRSNE